MLLRSADTDLSDGMTVPDGEWFNGNMFGGIAAVSSPTYRPADHPPDAPAGCPPVSP